MPNRFYTFKHNAYAYAIQEYQRTGKLLAFNQALAIVENKPVPKPLPQVNNDFFDVGERLVFTNSSLVKDLPIKSWNLNSGIVTHIVLKSNEPYFICKYLDSYGVHTSDLFYICDVTAYEFSTLFRPMDKEIKLPAYNPNKPFWEYRNEKTWL